MRHYLETIKGKIIASVVLIHTVLMLFFIFDNLTREYNLIRENSLENSHAIGSMLAANMSSWLLSRDFVELNELIKAAADIKDFDKAFVMDINGKVVASSDSGFINHKLTDEISLQLFDSISSGTYTDLIHHDHIDSIHPIKSGDVTIGAIRVLFDYKTVNDKFTDLLTKAIIYAFVAIILGALFAWLLMEAMSKRLRNLTRSAAEISQGKLATELPETKGNDEIDMLTRALIKMQSEISRTIDQLNKANEALEIKVEDAVAKRRQQEQILIQQSKMAAMGEMMSAIAHQWRQPLNALVLLVQDIEDAYEFGELNSEYLKESAARAMKLAGFMSSTIDDFRNFFKPSKESEEFDLTQAIESSLAILESQLTNNNIEIVFNKPATKTTAWGYQNEFKHVIVNILNNSRQAIVDHKKGGKITIDLVADENGKKITICDDGVGIDKSLYSKIFEPYYTTKMDIGGTGIGLYMSKIIIENNMKGKLELLDSKEGACFMISLVDKEQSHQPKTDQQS